MVDHGLGPIKAGPTCLSVPVCVNDAVSSKPVSEPGSVGRDAADAHKQTSICNCVVRICGSKRCKTCQHVSESGTFTSNITHKCYNVVSPNPSMDCNTKNVIYLISCTRCGVQYVGETGQKLRNRINNHRNRLRKLSALYLYQHFNSDGHTEDDISIMPIEEVTLSPEDKMSLSAKRLEREDFWYRELCTVYPYGLNDNVRKVGNVSKYGPELVVHTLFNRQLRKFRKRKMRKTKRKVEVRKLTEEVDTLLADYKCCNFGFRMRTFVLGLPRKYLLMLFNIWRIGWLLMIFLPVFL